jgi:hypothetical protein
MNKSMHIALLALAQYSGAPGIGFVLTIVYLGSAVSGMRHLWARDGHFYDCRRWVKVLLTLAILVLPVLVLFLDAKLSRPD